MINYFNDSKIFAIETKNMSYIFCLNPYLQNLYWGKKVCAADCGYLIHKKSHSSFDQDINREREEYGFWSGSAFVQSCLKVDFSHNRRLDMEFIDWTISTKENGAETLSIHFKNSDSDLYASVCYDVYDEYDFIDRYVQLENKGKPITIENFKSASISLPELKDYHMRYLAGKWAGEFQVRDLELNQGTFTMQSKTGTTGSHYNPVFAIHDGNTTETSGQVFYGMLGYSGNWKIDVEKTIYNNVRVTGGISDFDFSYELKSGELLTSPKFLIGFAANGYGDMSRKLHRYQRKYILPSDQPGRVLYNSWEATVFDVNVEEQKKLADRAAAMGIELFVIDDGWFGERHSDLAGLGDWYVNKDKFPNGLSELTGYVKGLGMDFGIWVEPEAVNPDSDLFRAHPDWIYHFNGLEPVQLRNQYVLNISKPEVKEFIIDFMTKLLTENPDVTFIKWDMNRSITDMSAGHTKTDKELWYKHTQSLYRIWQELREKFPHVEFETCSGGGARVDLGILKFANQCWPSDNTDAFERLFIQEGFSYFYNAKIMMCWVTETRKDAHKYIRPDSYKFHSSMMGGLGIGANISKFNEQEVTSYKELIAEYKEIRNTVQFGNQYRLLSPREGSLAAVQYVSQDQQETVVFAFLNGQKFGDFLPKIKLQGLEENAVYLVGEQKIHGNVLMNIGLQINLFGDFDSCLVKIKKV